MEDNLKICRLEDDLKILKSNFEFSLTVSNNVIKQVLLKSCYITTFPGEWGGWEESIIRLSSVQLQLNLPAKYNNHQRTGLNRIGDIKCASSQYKSNYFRGSSLTGYYEYLQCR